MSKNIVKTNNFHNGNIQKIFFNYMLLRLKHENAYKRYKLGKIFKNQGINIELKIK